MRTRARDKEHDLSDQDAADLAERLGGPELYDHQRRSITGLVEGRDGMVVAATGSGKTEIFLAAGILRGGLTLIVSPLRSLIADQWRRLEALELPVRIWNSDVKEDYKGTTLRFLQTGWKGFIITTPESLKGQALSGALRDRVDLAIVDEGHCCLTDRGFRSAYALLGGTLDKIGPAVRFACTATLTATDRDALVKALGLRDPFRVIQPIARSNITIRIVERHPATITDILNEHRGNAGIIFAATVCTAKKLYAKLKAQGRSVALYHGQLTAKQKKRSQAEFMSGTKLVAIATDAFILGIDKSDLRFVVHYDHPKSISDWTQGFGRVGRDGKPSNAYGCFTGSIEGRESRQFLLDATFPPVADFRGVWEYLIAAPFRDETPKHIAMHVLGQRGKYSSASILSTLQRFHLATAEINPADRRRKTYRGVGDFDQADWSPYTAEKDESQKRFDQLCELATLPDKVIPNAIDEYFETT